jgi:hypothetical protein
LFCFVCLRVPSFLPLPNIRLASSPCTRLGDPNKSSLWLNRIPETPEHMLDVLAQYRYPAINTGQISSSLSFWLRRNPKTSVATFHPSPAVKIPTDLLTIANVGFCEPEPSCAGWPWLLPHVNRIKFRAECDGNSVRAPQARKLPWMFRQPSDLSCASPLIPLRLFILHG